MKKLAENLELYFDHLMKEKESKKAHAKRAVLWVDDRPENNRLERSVLEQYGMEFTLALSTQQALQCIKYNRFDLVISDLGRKEGAKEGYVLLEEIRKRDRKMPFLIYASEACRKIRCEETELCNGSLVEKENKHGNIKARLEIIQ